MVQTLKPLLELQVVDLTRDRLVERRERLPEKSELADLERRIGEVRGAIGAVDGQLLKVGMESNRLEGELQALEDKIGREEAKLYGGEVSNPKELSALQSEIAMLKRRKEPLEEHVLEQMVLRDESIAEKQRLESETADLQREASALRERIASAEDDIDRRLAAESARWDEIVPQIPGEVLELYSSLREQRKGVGAGALENGICSACREALSAMEVDRIKQAARAGEVNFRCEHCRRILVVQ